MDRPTKADYSKPINEASPSNTIKRKPVQDTTHLAPLVSQLDINDRADSHEPSRSRNVTTSLRASLDKVRSIAKPSRGSLDKPLPDTPSEDDYSLIDIQAHPGVRPVATSTLEARDESRASYDNASDSTQHHDELRAASLLGAPRELQTAADLDLNDSTDTTQHTNWNTPVTHETIVQDVHEITEQQVSMHMHKDHVYHRILPIRDVEVLPPRHFIEVEGGLKEVSADQIGKEKRSKDIQGVLSQALRKELPKDVSPPGPRQFTARSFPGNEGDATTYVDGDGMVHSSETWVHRPTVDEGGKDSKQTEPLYIP